jgi:hypothetical protein
MKVESGDNLAKVEQMAQDMRQSKRQELREMRRTKSRAAKTSSCAESTTPREIWIETLEVGVENNEEQKETLEEEKVLSITPNDCVMFPP